jgi:NAD(P)-dependent dehydrogenase (short-subunit alcohol dehydrogenase family)
MASEKPVWFITGCSTGFGYELAKLILGQGGRAVVTARDKSKLGDLVRGAEDRALALSLDVTDQGQIDAAVKAAEAKFGAVDVLVNNAGYGYQASIEEGDDKAIRDQFDVPSCRACARAAAAMSSTSARSPVSWAFRARAIMPPASMRSKASPTRSRSRASRSASR